MNSLSPANPSSAEEAVTKIIEAILRLEDAAMRRRTWADLLADRIAEFTGTLSQSYRRSILTHSSYFA